MNTVIIYDQVGEAPICYYVVQGDYSRLNGVYGNNTLSSEALQAELFKIVFNDDWTMRPSWDTFPVQAVKDGAKVIVCGFMP